MSPLSRGFVVQLARFVSAHGLPLVQFRKDAVMAEHLRCFAGEEGVVFVCKAQVQIPVNRGQSFRRIADSVPVIADSL